MLSSVEKNPFSTSPGSCRAPAVAAPRRGHSRTPSAPPTFTPSQLRELAELRCLPAASSMRGPHVSLVTVIVKGGALGDVQTDQQNRICALRPASSAADAGLRIGDVIVSVDGGPLSRPLSVLLAEGEELTIELKRSMTLMGGMRAPPPPSMPDSPPSLLHVASAAAGEATSDTDSLASQAAAAPTCVPSCTPACAPARARGHRRQQSAPPGSDKLASIARASLGMPPSATGSEGDGPPNDKAGHEAAHAQEGVRTDGALKTALKGWWTERAKQQISSCKGHIPMPAFLEDVHSAEEDGCN